MAVDTERKHWECVKCKQVFSPMDRRAAEKEPCPELGVHELKVVQTSWNKSALGATVNLVGKGAKAAAKKSSSKKESRPVVEDDGPDLADEILDTAKKGFSWVRNKLKKK